MAGKHTLAERYAMAEQFIRRMRKYRNLLSCQEYTSLKGQAVSGDLEAAETGLQTIMKRHGYE